VSLQDRLLNSPGFRRQMHALTLESVRGSFANLKPPADAQPVSHDWQHLLLTASLMAQAPKERPQATALRIAHHCLNSTTNGTNHRVAAAIVLDLLTNSPSIKLAIEKNLLDEGFMERVPAPLRLDVFKRAAEFSVYRGDKVIHLNRFQKDVHNALESAECVSISAPTSAGKSFILENHVREYVTDSGKKNIVFVVPTRALIQQVETDLQSIFSDSSIKPIITSVPQLPPNWDQQSNILVYTQERLQWLMNDAPDEFKLDLLIIDEAQKVGDGARGVLLQQAIELATSRWTSCKVIFSSPMSSNPEMLFRHTGKTGVRVISELVTVNQNLIWVSQVPRDPKQWTAELCVHDGKSLLGTISLEQRPTDPRKRLAFIAQAMSDASGGTLIYASGQADAEKMAILLANSILEDVIDSGISDLIDLVAKTIHPKYALVSTLARGVAFHYGNIPLLIRTEIERLFKEGKIRYLVCTSTLIEGVNLPARSIFVRRPTKGPGRPMSEIDFWNMAGRAGRLGKEFQGNIICVDPDNWEEPPPQKRVRYKIERTLDKVTSQATSLINFIDSGKTMKGGPSKAELEHTLAYLFLQHSRHGSISKGPSAPECDLAILQQIDASLKSVSDKVTLPIEILTRNPGVNPLGQQSLLKYFLEYDDQATELIPTLPESDDAFTSYVRLLNRICTHLSGDPTQLSPYFAVLAINWMRGYPLSRIIADNIKYWGKHPEKKKTVPVIIRDSMRDVEEFARFKFVKYSACYVDILRFYFRTTGHAAHLGQIPDLNIWLEFGASQQTQISLMGIGLSRQTAISISELIPQHNMDRDAAIAWLKQLDCDSLDLSPIVIAELKKARSALL